LQAINQAREVYFHEVKQIGDTLRILARFN
jgi:hypothetical protein